MKRAALLLCVIAAGCTASDRYRGHHVPDEKLVTVLVPGYRGSFLYDHNRLAYLEPATAFRVGGESLGSCAGGMKPLDPGGPVTTFTIWPYAFDVYGGFMEWGEKALPGFTAFGYDWRADLPYNGGQLCEFIGDRRAQVIAHSMGGLVTMLAVQKCPEKISSVVFAGVPFRGAPGLFRDLFFGAPTNLNRALLSPEALWTFPATWQLLPRTDDFFVDEQGEQVTVPISAPGAWARWQVPCRARLNERLADRAAMPVDFATDPKRSLAVVGRGIASTTALLVRPDGLIDFERPQRGDGDGTVSVANATPPFEAEVVYTTADHLNLLDDPKVREAIEAFLK